MIGMLRGVLVSESPTLRQGSMSQLRPAWRYMLQTMLEDVCYGGASWISVAPAAHGRSGSEVAFTLRSC